MKATGNKIGPDNGHKLVVRSFTRVEWIVFRRRHTRHCSQDGQPQEHVQSFQHGSASGCHFRVFAPISVWCGVRLACVLFTFAGAVRVVKKLNNCVKMDVSSFFD
jgi:hypothetical protein